MRNISLTVGDRKLVSTKGHYKVPYRLPKKVEIFDLWWPWKVKVTKRNLRCRISCKRYELESLNQQKVIIKYHVGFPKKVKHLTFGDPERSRSLLEILDAEYLANGTRKRVCINRRSLQSPISASQTRWNIWSLVTLKTLKSQCHKPKSKMRNISLTVGDRKLVSTEGHYKVPYRLPKKVEIFDLRWPWKVKVTKRNLGCRISRKMYELESLYQTEGHNKVPCRLSKKGETFDLRWPWKVKVINGNLRCGISRKRYEKESLYQQKVITKSHIGFPKRWNIWSSVTLKSQCHKSKSKIRNISQTIRDKKIVSTEDRYKVPYRLPKRGEIFDLRWLWKVKITNRNLRCGISRQRNELESLYQQKVIIKSHIGFPIKVKYLTFGDPERLRSLMEI